MSSVDDVPWEESALEIELNITNNKGNNMSFADKFKALKAQQDEVVAQDYEEKGSIGGGKKFSIDADGVYTTIIDMATFHESKSTQSCWYELTLKTEDGQKIKTNMYVINKDGLTYRVDQDGRTRNNPDFSRMAGLNFIVNGEWDGLPTPELREIMVYDYEAKADVAKEMPVVTSLIGKPVAEKIHACSDQQGDHHSLTATDPLPDQQNQPGQQGHQNRSANLVPHCCVLLSRANLILMNS